MGGVGAAEEGWRRGCGGRPHVPAAKIPHAHRAPAAARTCPPLLPCARKKGGEAVVEEEGRGGGDEESNQRIRMGREERISTGRVTEW
jgi:hypothetical protein